MSVNYASGLSPYEHKGKCGMAEKFDAADVVSTSTECLAEWMKVHRNTVVITGAGISTSVGIPDFRGPSGRLETERYDVYSMYSCSVYIVFQ